MNTTNRLLAYERIEQEYLRVLDERGDAIAAGYLLYMLGTMAVYELTPQQYVARFMEGEK